MRFLGNYLKAVSYTHLDVYKRQISVRGGHILTSVEAVQETFYEKKRFHKETHVAQCYKSLRQGDYMV